jgi:outer membrane protein TolC
LDAIRASFDAPLDERQPRIIGSVASSDFGQRITQAVTSHPQLGASSASVRAAQARADVEGRAFFPRLSLGATLGSIVNGNATGGISPVLQVTQLVFDGGAAASRRVAAQARVFESRGARLEMAAALSLGAVSAWVDLRAARDRAAIAAENVRAHDRVLTQVQERATAGAGANTDVLTARARLATARARAAEAQANVERASAAFAQTFGQPAPANLVSPPDAPRLPAVSDAELIATSPRILGIDARIAAARADVAVAKSGRFPQLSIDGSAQRGGSRANLDVIYDPGAPGNKEAAIRASEAQLDAIQAERDALARDIIRALSDLRTDQRAGAARVAAARDAVRAHRATVEAAREEFSIGRRSILGLLDAQRDLFDASEVLIAAEREVALSGYAALALTGDILDAFAIRLPRPDAVQDTGTGTEPQAAVLSGSAQVQTDPAP